MDPLPALLIFYLYRWLLSLAARGDGAQLLWNLSNTIRHPTKPKATQHVMWLYGKNISFLENQNTTAATTVTLGLKS